MPITFLTREDVQVIHADMLLRYGGLPGIRDEGLVDITAFSSPVVPLT